MIERIFLINHCDLLLDITKYISTMLYLILR